MYILNLVLGCWIADDTDYDIPGEFLTNKEHSFKTLEDLIKHWNNCAEDWEDIHRPCIVEHFELYEKLPENWKTFAES